ncbi:MAG: hypothetical protein QM504_17745, partial [Pseudomonadota bacterium]
MEEHIGIFWHKFLGKLLKKEQPGQKITIEKTVKLNDIQRKMAIIFRGMAGIGSLQISSSFGRKTNTRRSILQKIAGDKKIVFSAWIEDDTLYLPEQIDIFSSKQLNQSLYLWLTAMAASDIKYPTDNLKNKPAYTNFWFVRNQYLTKQTLTDFPGLASSYQVLLDEVLASRPDMSQSSESEQKQEQVIILALKNPGSQALLPYSKYPPAPVALWLIQSINQLNNEMDLS